MPAWSESIKDPAIETQVRELMAQVGWKTPDGEPDFEAARTWAMSKYVGSDAALVNTEAGGAILNGAATGARMFKARFDDTMVTTVGAGEEAVSYLQQRLINFISTAPGSPAQKLANSLGRVLCEVNAQDPMTLERFTYKWVTENKDIAVKFYATPAAKKLTAAHGKTNDRAEVVLGVFADAEDDIRELLVEAVLKGVPKLTAAKANNTLLPASTAKSLTTGS